MTDGPGPFPILDLVAGDPALSTLLVESRARDAAEGVPDPTHDARCGTITGCVAVTSVELCRPAQATHT